MSSALVIGGSGLIGGATAGRLLEDGWDVVVADRKPDLTDHRFVPVDVAREAAVYALLERLRPTVVLNFAFLLSHATEADIPRAYCVNLGGMQHLLEGCRMFGVQRLVYASSISVYGEQAAWGGHELLETDRGYPLSMYGWHKLLNEETAGRYRRSFGLECVGVRISSVWGGGRRAGLSAPVTDLVEAAARGDTYASPWGSDQDFSLVHVADVARICAILASAPSLRHEVYNTGGEYATVSSLIDVLQRLAPWSRLAASDPPVHVLRHSSRVSSGRFDAEFAFRRTPLEVALADELDRIWFT